MEKAERVSAKKKGGRKNNARINEEKGEKKTKEAKNYTQALRFD